MHKVNRIKIILTFFVVISVQWIIFKSIYKDPNLVLDSYYYIKGAVLDLSTNAWPIGYSKFLQLFGYLSHSAYLLVTIQYLILNVACLFFFYTWTTLFSPGRLARGIVFVILFINPLLVFCANFILADSLFISLSLFWVSQMMWIIYRPRKYMIILHAVILVTAFTVRYNALYYPFLGSIAFLLCRESRRFKIAGILLPFLLVSAFIMYTSIEVGAMSGKRQFSPFGAWKLANDALYAYQHVPVKERRPLPIEYRGLDSMVNDFYQKTDQQLDLLKLDSASGSYFMFGKNSPLVLYMDRLYGTSAEFFGTGKWAAVAPYYQSYGVCLIKTYPVTFTKYFICPNLIRYFYPPGEIFISLDPFYFHETYGGRYVKELFNIETINTEFGKMDKITDFFLPYSVFFAAIHVLFILGIIGYFKIRCSSEVGRQQLVCIYLGALLWLFDFIFSILSAGVVLRYEIFVAVIELSFSIYFIEQIYKKLNVMDRVPSS